MEENIITLSKKDLIRLRIKTDDGKDTGEYLEFDLEDIELPLRYQELLEKDKKNKDWLQKEFIIIDKRQDVKGKKLLTKNQEDKIKALNKFFEEEVEIYNMFLGPDGVKKLLNGRKLGWTTLQEIDDIINTQILPYVKKAAEAMQKRIIQKYSQENKEVMQ